ncbi:hypothetical protein BDV97DRAFT_352395 [Delphinella strobiligena]|nr:hypothetical protein BDV97DRAFT_352395 [Delphinella strobiligena]
MDGHTRLYIYRLHSGASLLVFLRHAFSPSKDLSSRLLNHAMQGVYCVSIAALSGLSPSLSVISLFLRWHALPLPDRSRTKFWLRLSVASLLFAPTITLVLFVTSSQSKALSRTALYCLFEYSTMMNFMTPLAIMTSIWLSSSRTSGVWGGAIVLVLISIMLTAQGIAFGFLVSDYDGKVTLVMVAAGGFFAHALLAGMSFFTVCHAWEGGSRVLDLAYWWRHTPRARGMTCCIGFNMFLAAGSLTMLASQDKEKILLGELAMSCSSNIAWTSLQVWKIMRVHTWMPRDREAVREIASTASEDMGISPGRSLSNVTACK